MCSLGKLVSASLQSTLATPPTAGDAQAARHLVEVLTVGMDGGHLDLCAACVGYVVAHASALVAEGESKSLQPLVDALQRMVHRLFDG